MIFSIPTVLLAGLAVAAPPDAAALRKLPHVHSVEVTGPATRPNCRIVHVLNWHFVARDDYAADLRSVSEEPLSEEEIERHYDEFLASVETVQAEQLAVLRCLIQDHGLRAVYLEGLTVNEAPAFHRLVQTLRRFELHKPEGDTPIDSTGNAVIGVRPSGLQDFSEPHRSCNRPFQAEMSWPRWT